MPTGCGSSVSVVLLRATTSESWAEAETAPMGTLAGSKGFVPSACCDMRVIQAAEKSGAWALVWQVPSAAGEVRIPEPFQARARIPTTGTSTKLPMAKSMAAEHDEGGPAEPAGAGARGDVGSGCRMPIPVSSFWTSPRERIPFAGRVSSLYACKCSRDQCADSANRLFQARFRRISTVAWSSGPGITTHVGSERQTKSEHRCNGRAARRPSKPTQAVVALIRSPGAFFFLRLAPAPPAPLADTLRDPPMPGSDTSESSSSSSSPSDISSSSSSSSSELLRDCEYIFRVSRSNGKWALVCVACSLGGTHGRPRIHLAESPESKTICPHLGRTIICRYRSQKNATNCCNINVLANDRPLAASDVDSTAESAHRPVELPILRPSPKFHGKDSKITWVTLRTFVSFRLS